MTNGISNQTLRTLMVVITMVIVSGSLAGKRRCFCVLVAHLHNMTNCNPATGRPCSISTLNWIGDFGAAISYLGTSLISNLLRGNRNQMAHELQLPTSQQHFQDSRVLLQCGLLLVLGCTLSSFMSSYESLVLTDSLLQGLGASALMSIASLRLENVFPHNHRLHVLAEALTDSAPWGMFVFCPLYSNVLNHMATWQMLYSVLACIFIIECGLSSMVSSEIDDDNIQLPLDGQPTSVEPTKPPPEAVQQYIEEDLNNDMAILEQVYSSPVVPSTNVSAVPHYSEYLTMDNLSHLLSKQVIAMWCLERILFTMVTYGVITNMVDYMYVQFSYSNVYENPLDRATHITLIFAGCETLGFAMAIAVGDARMTRTRLLILTTASAALSAVVLFTWQMLHTYQSYNLDPNDIFVIACLLGLLTAMGSCFAYKLGQDISGKPNYVSHMLTTLSQAMGMFFAPLTSGMLIQVDGYDSFFIVQCALSLARVGLLVGLIYQFHNKTLRTLVH